MLRLSSEPAEDLSRSTENGWGARFALAEWKRAEGPPVGLIVAGVAVVGLGLLAWTYLGPDLKRYIKIHSM